MTLSIGPFTLPAALRRGGKVALRSLKFASAGLCMDTLRVHAKARLNPLASLHRRALVACAFAFAAGGALSATPANTAITNVASASFTLGGASITATGSATVVTSARTPATIEFLQYVASSNGLPPGLASVQNVGVTQCNAGGGFTPLPVPNVPGHGALSVPGGVLLAPASLYASGDVVFVRVIDYDQNVDPLVAETIEVTVSASNQDSERLRLTETGPSTGVFIGYISSTAAAMQAGDCLLNIGGNQRIVATYLDQSENNVAISAAALVDPMGVLFDSATGQPVNGAQVTLVNMATGQPATVLGNDGRATFPSTVTTGSTVTDGGGAVYHFAAGRYQFPRVAPGSYSFQVTPPAGYKFPSAVATATLQALPGAPFLIVAGSRGETFPIVPGPALIIDMPLDPGPLGDVTVTKTAGRTTAAAGDFVPYTVTIANGSKNAIPAVRILDRLPQGFRYQAGSARTGDVGPGATVLADPTISSDGRSLEFSLGTLRGNATAALRYVAAIGAGAPAGLADNTAQASGRLTSNVAHASLLVQEDLNRSRAILMGRVTQADACSDDETDAQSPKPKPLGGVRVMLQDGTYIVTDQEGRWHADNIRPGTHVVQLDTTSLPQGYELKSCERNTRTAGRDFSQFVNVRGGTLWRSDFRLVRVASCVNEQLSVNGQRVTLKLGAPVASEGVTATLMLPNGAKVVAGSARVDDRPSSEVAPGDGFMVLRLGAQNARWVRTLTLDLEAPATGDLTATLRFQPQGQPFQSLAPLVLKGGQPEATQCAPIVAPSAAKPSDVAAQTAQVPAAPAQATLVEQLPYDDKWIAAAGAGTEWLHPQTGFVPALPVVKVVVKHEPHETVQLRVNGQPVNPLRYEGSVMNPAGTLALSNWRAVDLKDGDNRLEVTVMDTQHKVILQEVRNIHYGVNPSSVAFDAKRSRLVADGKTPPLIAVQMLDKDGQPVRRGVRGEVQISPPYVSKDLTDAIQREPLSGSPGGRPHFEIGEDGVALIALQATTQAGEVVLNFDFGNNRTNEVRAWLTPDLREWVMVGFAEGTLGHKTLSGNMESLTGAGADDKLFDQNRLAFYAKGQVKGEYLLTVAYDSAKEKDAPGTRVLKQAVDPTRFYTLYADASQAQFDAASARKLYLKIEKSQFYAMFGDFDTGLTVTELGRYGRTLNGFKSEFKGERFSYSAFASKTSQHFRKDEFQGDGTSGLYRLSGRNIIVNSDRLRLETRDRIHPEVILNTRTFTPYVDYQFDFVLGTVFFHEPIPTRDGSLNPVFIVAEYESDDQSDARLTYGGRAAMKIGPKSEVGLTHIHEGNAGHESSLTGADAKVQLGETTMLKAEFASSNGVGATGPVSGRAYLVELTHDDGALGTRAYVRKQEPGFGVGQQANASTGTQKVGADVRLKLSDSLQVQAEAFQQENLVTQAKAQAVEVRAQWSKEALTASAGVRAAHETDALAQDTTTRQVTGGVTYEMMDRKLLLRASSELDVGSHGASTMFPNRLVLGADYRLSPLTTLFAQEEHVSGAAIKANTARLGLRTELWSGGQLSTSLGDQSALDSSRLYADMGLAQKFKIDDHWNVDFGIDRVQMLRTAVANPLNNAQVLPSATPQTAAPGIVTGNYTTLSSGAAYKDKVWSGAARLEWRHGDADTKINVLLGAQRQLDDGRALAAALSYNMVDSKTTVGAAGVSAAGVGAANDRKLDARLSYAHRPPNSQWIWLDRLEYVHESTQDLAGRLFTRKLINNFNANWTPNRTTQVALQYSSKYVRDAIEASAYRGYTDLTGIEARYDLNPSWDIGLHAGMLHSWVTHSRDYQLGVSVGYKLTDNSWLTIGYNQVGFTDTDFTGAEYRAKGLYVNLRAKFDQDTFDLNDRVKGQLPFKP